jgi:superfamily II DNA or RNA helicase/HKD family nuclease
VRGPLADGVYDHLLDDALSALTGSACRDREVSIEDLEPGRTASFVAAHLKPLVERVLASVQGEPAERQRRRIEILNRLLSTIAEAAEEHCGETPFGPGELKVQEARHLRLVRPRPVLGASPAPVLPETPLAESALLVNASGEPSLASELGRELATADRVDLLCAFVKWSGLRVLIDALAAVVERGRARGEASAVRVLTTTYIGASEVRALDELARIGAEVRISYDDRRTRLHAKAWLFHRESGSHTAYIGSSNLSRSALHEGLEWNVRLSWRDSGPLLTKFRAAFESYRGADEFVPYDPGRDRERVVRALAAQRTRGSERPLALRVDMTPHPHQTPMLEALRVERGRGHMRNLLVAPTGTGKTLVAAFDYAELRRDLPRARLLFVAHRERILTQSRGWFATVLKDPDFGELLTGETRVESGEHVFATIQSLSRMSLDAELPPEHFDVVIVDEFHHAEAPTYERLLEHVRPRVLLGLTATPERHDGGDVRRWFDGRTAYEMRLWEALEQGLLAPFQYFGVKDSVDLDDVTWKRGWGYDRTELAQRYVVAGGAEARARLVIQEVRRRVTDVRRMRALAFCVSVEHARFMASWFEREGIASAVVLGETPREERDAAVRRLESSPDRPESLRVLFTVDLFNEGVDIPTVDTILFLRPTESATVFLQQLGRGLRLHRDKPCLTVLDFIGNARREFRFDRRFRALLGGTTRQVERQIEAGFPYLPPGCAMRLDRKAQEVVLANIRHSIGAGQRWLQQELTAMGAGTTVGEFLREAGVEPVDLYASGRSFASLRHAAFGGVPLDEEARRRHARLRGLLHVNDPLRLGFLRDLAAGEPLPSGEREDRLAAMAAAALLDVKRPAEAWGALEAACANETFRQELGQLVGFLEDGRREGVLDWRGLGPAPLQVHARYRQDEILAALRARGEKGISQIQGGVYYEPVNNADILFVTLRKDEGSFSPTTMYRDYAISPSRFHWESQNWAHSGSAAGRRYLAGSSHVLLFVREVQDQANGVAEAYAFLGKATLESSEGERPMRIVWRLEHPMPGPLYTHATVAAG